MQGRKQQNVVTRIEVCHRLVVLPGQPFDVRGDSEILRKLPPAPLHWPMADHRQPRLGIGFDEPRESRQAQMHSLAIDEAARIEDAKALLLPRPRWHNSANDRRRFFRPDREFNSRLIAEAARHELQCLARRDIDALGACERLVHERGERDH